MRLFYALLLIPTGLVGWVAGLGALALGALAALVGLVGALVMGALGLTAVPLGGIVFVPLWLFSKTKAPMSKERREHLGTLGDLARLRREHMETVDKLRRSVLEATDLDSLRAVVESETEAPDLTTQLRELGGDEHETETPTGAPSLPSYSGPAPARPGPARRTSKKRRGRR